MAELVDASDSKSDSARSAGSIPARGTSALNHFKVLAGTPLGDLLPRLWCAQCGDAPVTIDLVASPSDGAKGAAYAAGSRLQIRPTSS
jgi:hypothetical protein